MKRCYRQYCGLARALDVVGERWTLLIIRNLLLGPRRYVDLMGGLPGITTNLLARRLKELEGAGLIEKVERPPPERASLYQLTAIGRELEPALMALGRWGGRLLAGGPERDDTVDIGWGLVSLKRRYVGGFRRTIELRVGPRVFQIRMSADYLDVREGAPWEPELCVRGDQPTVAALLLQGASAGALIDEGRIEVEGDETIWRELLDAFSLAA